MIGEWSNVVAEGLRAPWKISLELSRMAALPWHRACFSVWGVSWSDGLRLYGTPRVQRYAGSTIRLGKNLVLNSCPSSNPLSPDHPVVLATRSAGATLEIGDGTGITGGTICACESIWIGARVLIGPNCLIVDSDFHPLQPQLRRRQPNAGNSAPVRIEDDVFLGAGCFVLKGARIGGGSVVGAGSVVTGIVPPNVLCAGNPAKAIRTLE